MWPLSHSLAVLVLSPTFVHLTEHAHTHARTQKNAIVSIKTIKSIKKSYVQAFTLDFISRVG